MSRVVILSRTSQWGLEQDAKLVEQVFREAQALKWLPVRSLSIHKSKTGGYSNSPRSALSSSMDVGKNQYSRGKCRTVDQQSMGLGFTVG